MERKEILLTVMRLRRTILAAIQKTFPETVEIQVRLISMNATIPFSQHKVRMLLLSLTAVLLTGTAFGQATTGSISGHVTDPAGSVVQGAAISVQNVVTRPLSTF